MPPRSHGTGLFTIDQLASCGEGCVIEPEVLIFHPENVHLGREVYVGHRAILKGYHDGVMRIGDRTWIGQQCFFHSAGGITIGNDVGVGPAVKILTSTHKEAGLSVPIVRAPIERAPVVIEDHADIGIGAILLPGVRVGHGAQVGAGAVVTEDVPAFAVVAGVPAKVLRLRASD